VAAFPRSTAEQWAVDEHGIGLKPVLHKVWTLGEQRPVAELEAFAVEVGASSHKQIVLVLDHGWVACKPATACAGPHPPALSPLIDPHP
jgi:hypothetical protein